MKMDSMKKDKKINLLQTLKEDFSIFAFMSNMKYSPISFIILFIKNPAYRRLLDYRFKTSGVFLLKFLRPFTFLSSIHINLLILSDNNTSNIGGGPFFVHGFSTIIYCKSMGKNCRIYQQVTIGNNNGIPTIGNDVEICAGAKVIGPIHIGDDVIIGANAVVTKDIPSHSMVVGVPGKIIKTRKSKNDSWEKISETNNYPT